MARMWATLPDNINRVCPYCKTVYDDCLQHLVAECECNEAIRQDLLTFVETEISLVLYLELSNTGAETFLQYVLGAPFIPIYDEELCKQFRPNTFAYIKRCCS